MKLFSLMACFFVFVPSLHAQDAELRVMSFNIRCGSCEQPADVNHWSRRSVLVADVVERQKPDLLALQEAELFQVRGLAASLADYGWLGVGRDDGKEQGETTAILYRKSRFLLNKQQTLWLSDTPEAVSKGWDAALNRTVTIAMLTDHFNARPLALMNTHFDHQGQQAKLESSKLIAKLATSTASEVPVIVTGDLNYTKAFAGYQSIVAALRDAEMASISPPAGGDFSFNGFGKVAVPGNKIDFIFVSEQFEVVSHTIVTDRYGQLYPSDHFPVVAVLRFK